MNSDKRIKQLEGLRVFMCLTIMFSHFAFNPESSLSNFVEKFLSRGVFAVDFFFILSGFGLYLSLAGGGGTA